MLENTSQEDFEEFEKTEDYLGFASMIIERLSQALKIGYLPCFFVPVMNLLQGFGQKLLNDIAYIALIMYSTITPH